MLAAITILCRRHNLQLLLIMLNETSTRELRSAITCLRMRLHLIKLLYNKEAYLTWSSMQPLKLVPRYHADAPLSDAPPPYISIEKISKVLDETAIAKLLITSAETLLKISQEVSESAQSKEKMTRFASGLSQTAEQLRKIQQTSTGMS